MLPPGLVPSSRTLCWGAILTLSGRWFHFSTTCFCRLSSQHLRSQLRASFSILFPFQSNHHLLCLFLDFLQPLDISYHPWRSCRYWKLQMRSDVLFVETEEYAFPCSGSSFAGPSLPCLPFSRTVHLVLNFLWSSLWCLSPHPSSPTSVLSWCTHSLGCFCWHASLYT